MSIDLTIRVPEPIELEVLLRQAHALTVELLADAPPIEAYALERGIATRIASALIGRHEGVLLLAWRGLDDRVLLVTNLDEDVYWTTASVGATKSPTELTLALLTAAALEILTGSRIEDRGGEWSTRREVCVANFREVMSHVAGGSFSERCGGLTTALGIL